MLQRKAKIANEYLQLSWRYQTPRSILMEPAVVQNRFEAIFLKMDEKFIDTVLAKEGVGTSVRDRFYRLFRSAALSEDRPTKVRDHAFKLLGYYHDKCSGVLASDVEKLNSSATCFEETKSPWQALEGVYRFRKALQLLPKHEHGMGLRLPEQSR
jgi:hypothetical protein